MIFRVIKWHIKETYLRWKVCPEICIKKLNSPYHVNILDKKCIILKLTFNDHFL